jgi:Fur family zinc uptake transcriptional regulator
VLAQTRKPLGAYQIREEVGEAGGKIDVVSVYRILAALVEAGLAHRIGSVDGYLACPSSHSGDHGTEHLICTSCGCVEEIPIPQTAMSEIGVAGSRLGFMGQATRVEVLGVCEHCR